ncbi:MAG TPA: PAS domain-containing protein, partial [Hymenobacter sp.]|nr:PAS domain-containing protein [Hymenobacter sp.]
MSSAILSTAALPTTLSAAHAEIEALRARLQRQQQGLAATQLHAAWMQAVHEGLLLLDADDRVLFINDGYCQLLGLPLPSSHWIGRSRQELTKQLASLLADPDVLRMEMQRTHADSQAVYGARLSLRDGRVLERDFLPYTDEEGQRGTLVHYRDVTAPHQVEEHLCTISRISDQNPNPILRLGTDHQQLYANPAAERLRTELQPDGARELQQQAFAWADAVLASGREARYTTSIGGRHFTANAVPFLEEQYVNLYLADITERVLAEQRQMEQQAFTQQVLDTSPNLIYVRDAAGNTLFENQAMRRLRNEARLPISSDMATIAAMQQREREHYAAADAQVLATEQEVTAEDPLTLPTG